MRWISWGDKLKIVRGCRSGDVAAVAGALKYGTKTLNLYDQGIGVEGVRVLSKALASNVTLRVINLGNSGIGDEGVRVLSEFLARNATFSTIWLDDNGIGDDGANSILDTLATNQTLIEIHLERNNINEDTINTINQMLAANKRLQENPEANAKATAEVKTKVKAKAYAEAKAEAKAKAYADTANDDDIYEIIKLRDDDVLTSEMMELTSLHLYSREITAEDMKIIIQALENNTSITTLNFAHNDMDRNTVNQLFRVLRNNNTITTIRIIGNNVRDSGVRALSAHLKSNRTIHTIDLSWNDITDKGLETLVKAQKLHQSLNDIVLKDNSKITSNGRKQLEDALAAPKLEKPLKPKAEVKSDADKLSNNPSMWAMSYQQLQDVKTEAMNLYKDDFKLKTMRDVNDDIIIPKCQLTEKSFALSLNPEGLKTDVFVSHSWDEHISQFIDSIEEAYCTEFDKPNLWICAFGLFQGNSATIQSQLDTPLAESPFVKALQVSKRFLVVRNSRTDLYSRIWCILEVMYAKKYGFIPNKTQVAGPDTFTTAAHTSCLDATSYDPKDRDKILRELLMNEGSREEVDNYIKEFRTFNTGRKSRTDDVNVSEKNVTLNTGSVEKFFGTTCYTTMKTELDKLGVEEMDDLRELDDEDIDSLAATLKKVAAKKFRRKINELVGGN